MRHFIHLLVLTLLASTAGCFSVARAPLPHDTGDQVVVSNYGWFLFDCIPIVCGNSDPDSLTPWIFFRDDVTMPIIQRKFVEIANSSSNQLSNLVYRTHSEVMFEIPGVNIPLPIPYLLTYREIQLSGVLK